MNINTILGKLYGNIFGLLIVIWLFVLIIGNYNSAFALLEGKKNVYNAKCIEMTSSIDVGGSECVEYGDTQTLTIKENFIKSLWIPTIITGGIGFIILIRHIDYEIKYRLNK